MRLVSLRPLLLALFASAILPTAAFAASPDHHEFEATLEAPFTGTAGEAREFTLRFGYVDAQATTAVAWRLELADKSGMVLRHWHGEERLYGDEVEVVVPWDGYARAKTKLADGFYAARLITAAGEPIAFKALTGTLAERVDKALALPGVESIAQSWDIEVGKPRRPEMPDFVPLPLGALGEAMQKSQAATASLPYTVYFGNLHTQSNDSDGGGAIGSCSSSQPAQTGQYGPGAGFDYSYSRGLDFSAATEHNHYFDGSSSTNTSADPTTAKNRYQAGLTAASNFNVSHPGSLAVYGMEWGVISNGGHLNIFNSNELLSWEYNSSSQLIGDTYTEKNNYAALYTLMKGRGWVGQFNHPSSTTQFIVGGTDLGYHADGDEVMVLSEVMNTSAFSSNTTETETSRSTYEGAVNKLLERGFHVAFATNQDNHCANWGASYTNRTGVLIPTGTALTLASFVAALKARRVYATMDKTSQLILTANGRVMGERFANSGALTLTANFASTSGRTVSQVQIFEGVPKRNGTVTQLSSTAVTTITPANGEHFYYAKLTQDDGKILWSAPVWVSQGAAPSDTTAPTVSASESGTSGTITLSATASDNVGVTRVEFLVDNVLKGTDTTAPYSITLDSTTLTNGTHSLTAKAYDAANNVGTSAAVSFSISNATGDTTAPTVSASESGTSGTITLSATASDNVGVTKVEFLVDNVLKGTDTTAPYSITLNSTTLANGTHSLTAKAYDAANNVGTSAAVSFSISNTTSTQLVLNGGYESGSTNWTATSGVITNDAGYAARGGTWKAWMLGYGSAHTDTLYQTLTIPSTATSATLTFWLRVDSAETGTTAWDTMKAQIRNSSNTVLSTLATYSNVNETSGYVQKSFNVIAHKGTTIRVYFLATEGSQFATSFLVDDVSLISQ